MIILKVLLVNPHQSDQGGYSNPPLGLLYLASAVRDIAEVEVIDGYLVGFDGIKAKIDEGWDVVGITCYTPGRHKALEIAKHAKERGATTVLGGPHPTIMHKQIKEHYPFVDVVINGEGENGLRYLVNNLSQGYPFEVGPGYAIGYSLDNIRFPAWDLIDLSRYPGGSPTPTVSGPRIPIIFSRGCTGHCSFCSTWWIWGDYRARSPENMVAEIEMLVSMGHRHFVFEDDAMSCYPDLTKAMLRKLISRGLDIAFHATTKVETIDDELAKLLKEAGCYGVSLGVESGDEGMLRRIGKTITPADSLRAIRSLHDAGLAVCALTLVGYPGETTETVNRTIELLRESEVEEVGTIGCIWVFPGTKLYRECKEKGMIDDSFWLGPEETFIYTEPHFELEKWHNHVCAKQRIE